MRPLHNTEDRGGDASITLKRATHLSVPYTQDGRPQTVPVSKTTHKPRPRRARRLPPQHLVQPATTNVRAILADQPVGDLNTTGRCAARIIKAATQLALRNITPLPDSNALLQWNEGLPRQVAALRTDPPIQQQGSTLQLQEPPFGQQIPFPWWRYTLLLLVPSAPRIQGTNVYAALLLPPTRKTTSDINGGTFSGLSRNTGGIYGLSSANFRGTESSTTNWKGFHRSAKRVLFLLDGIFLVNFIFSMMLNAKRTLISPYHIRFFGK